MRAYDDGDGVLFWGVSYNDDACQNQSSFRAPIIMSERRIERELVPQIKNNKYQIIFNSPRYLPKCMFRLGSGKES